MAHDAQISDPSILSLEARTHADVVLEAVLENGVRDDLAIDINELKRLRKENKKKAKKDSSKEEDTTNGNGKKNGGGGDTGKKNPFAMLLDQVD